jgi:predicted membrane protein
MIKTRTIVSGAIALAHISTMPFIEKGIVDNESSHIENWWVLVSIVITFSLIFAVMILTAEEKKIKISHLLNTFAGVLVACWFFLILTNNITNMEYDPKKAFLISFGYFLGLLLVGFIFGKLIDKFFKRSNL